MYYYMYTINAEILAIAKLKAADINVAHVYKRMAIHATDTKFKTYQYSFLPDLRQNRQILCTPIFLRNSNFTVVNCYYVITAVAIIIIIIM